MDIQPEVTAALIGAVTSAVITPVMQIFINKYEQKKSYEANIAPVLENIRVLKTDLLQIPINPKIERVSERIGMIESFYHPIFNDIDKHSIKMNYVEYAKRLAARHQDSRPWMEIEYPEHVQFFNNHTERLIAALDKKPIPKQFNPFPDDI